MARDYLNYNYITEDGWTIVEPPFTTTELTATGSTNYPIFNFSINGYISRSYIVQTCSSNKLELE